MGPVMTGPSFISGLRQPPRFHNSFTKYEKFFVAQSSPFLRQAEAPARRFPGKNLPQGAIMKGQ